MSTPSSVFTEIVTTSMRQNPGTLADNVSKNNALYHRLKSKDRLTTVSGGYEIIEPLMYAENSTFQRYSGYDTLSTAASDVITAAKYEWKQAAVNITASGLELRSNAGKEQMINLTEAKINVAKMTFANNLNQDLYSDGTADSGKQIGGLQSIITEDGTGTVGGINSGTHSFWANKFLDANSATSSDIRNKMQTLWLATTRGNDRPDLIVADTNMYSLYYDSLSDIQRISANDMADAGFASIKFNGTDVVHETSESGIPADTMYFLNTDYLKFVAHKDANMSVMEERISVNQDSVVIPILLQGNLVCSNRALQGVLFETA